LLQTTANAVNFTRHLSLEFDHIDHLKAYKNDGIDIAHGAASSLITALNDPKLDAVKYREKIFGILNSTLAVYFSFQKHLSSMHPDFVYAFNG
jgi:hypothetical protein